MQTPSPLLLVEDDASIAQALLQALAQDYCIDWASTGKAAIYKADREAYRAILLDLNLPDVPGLAICQQLRERGATAPILILSAETRILTKINLLDAGADDYLTKPFSLGELKARLRVLERRVPDRQYRVTRLQVGDLVLDTTLHEVRRAGRPVRLRRKEFALLACLMERAGSVVSRETLVRQAWRGQEEPWKNTVDVHIKYLRDKIDRPFGQPMIDTVHGVGYRLAAPSAVGAKACRD